MKLLLLVCAETSVVDQATNRASLFNLLEEVATPTFPILIYSTVVYTSWEREEADSDTQADVSVKLNDKQLFTAQLAINFQQAMRCRSVLTALGLVLTEPGTLVFDIIFGGQVLGSYHVPVKSISQSSEVAAP